MLDWSAHQFFPQRRCRRLEGADAIHVLWLSIVHLHPTYRLILQGIPYNDNWYLLAFTGLTIGFFVWGQERLQRLMTAYEFALGSAWMSAVLGLFVSIFPPGANFLLAWPVLTMLAAISLVFLRPTMSSMSHLLLV